MVSGGRGTKTVGRKGRFGGGGEGGTPLPRGPPGEPPPSAEGTAKMEGGGTWGRGEEKEERGGLKAEGGGGEGGGGGVRRPPGRGSVLSSGAPQFSVGRDRGWRGQRRGPRGEPPGPAHTRVCCTHGGKLPLLQGGGDGGGKRGERGLIHPPSPPRGRKRTPKPLNVLGRSRKPDPPPSPSAVPASLPVVPKRSSVSPEKP